MGDIRCVSCPNASSNLLCLYAEGAIVPVSLVNPDGIFKPQTYWQAAVAEGSRIIHLSGQVAWDQAGATVGVGDLATQTEQAYMNVARALDGLKASFLDVVKLNVYVVDWSSEKQAQFREGLDRAARRLDIDLRRPITLIGVTCLVQPDLLIEVEVVAVLS
jgi:enamine deaminase RidA (YjgF/YER057c/UK114 family)